MQRNTAFDEVGLLLQEGSLVPQTLPYCFVLPAPTFRFFTSISHSSPVFLLPYAEAFATNESVQNKRAAIFADNEDTAEDDYNNNNNSYAKDNDNKEEEDDENDSIDLGFEDTPPTMR